jgi:hypothetical protein
MISCAASGSAASRRVLSRRSSISQASSCDRTSRVNGSAPATTSGVRRSRLVVTTNALEVPGSKGRTWSASRALSSITRTRLPAIMLR